MTIGELLGTLPYYSGVEFQDDAILGMSEYTPCGRHCARVLRLGSVLMEQCADMRDELRALIVRQVEIFYYG